MTKKAAATKVCATLLMRGKKTTASGISTYAAIQALAIDHLPKSWAVLTITKGNAARERILPRPIVSRLFSPSPLVRDTALKNITTLFDL